MLSIITACSRPDNLQLIYDSIDFRSIHTWYIIYDTSKDRSYPHIFKDNPKVKEINYNKPGFCGHPQINYALDLIEDGFVYIMDDDNIIHADFWKVYRSLDANFIYTWDQNRIRESRIMKGDKIKLMHIDTSQFIVPRKYIGSIKWDNYRKGADFKFINDIHEKFPEKFKYIEKTLCYHNYLKKHVAICFFGLTRSLKWTLPSIKKYIFGPLNSAKISYDVLLHTYKITESYTSSWSGEKGLKLNNDEYKLLNPRHHIIEDKKTASKKIDLKKYRTKGNPWVVGNPKSGNTDALDNHILYLWSQKQLTTLWQKDKEKYTHVILCRPDVLYLNPINPEWFSLISEEIHCPSFAKHGHVNDRFALGRTKEMAVYGSRFDDALEYSKKRLLASEAYLDYTLKHNGIKVKDIKFDFIRIRADGKSAENDYKELRRYFKTRKIARIHHKFSVSPNSEFNKIQTRKKSRA